MPATPSPAPNVIRPGHPQPAPQAATTPPGRDLPPATRARSPYERYQPWRRWVEPGFWIALLTVGFVFNAEVSILDVHRVLPGMPTWKPVAWEASSHLVVLALVPALIAFERRFPLSFATFRRNLPWHVLGTVVFCLVHVTAMVGLRQLAYAWMGESYDFGPWPRGLFYEYLKDWRTYATFLLIIGFYDLLLLRLQGEASLLDEPDEGIDPPEPIERPDRFLVRKLGKEFLIAANDIEYLQASGNYVNLHVKGRAYPLRSTMAALEPRLDPSRFARVHRSWMVNLDLVAEIEPLETGDARIHLRDGTQVPCSRKYRATLKR